MSPPALLRRGALAAAVLALLWSAAGALPKPAAPLPKYGPAAVRLHADRDYVRRHDAPDFWSLIPYYLPQLTDSSCSVASVAMLVNALRAERALRADEKLAGHRELLERVGDAAWTRAVQSGGDGVDLDQLGRLIARSLSVYGVAGYAAEVVHTADRSDATAARLRAVLTANEASSRDLLVVNFLQSVFTGDPQGAVGHIAPVAAYDAERRRVLILDPDRDWYEPYWVSEQTLLEAMTTEDPSVGRSRGFVWIRSDASTAGSTRSRRRSAPGRSWTILRAR